MENLNKIKIFYDGLNIDEYSKESYIKGFTTNPSILSNSKKFNNYKELALYFISKSNNLPVSFEIFADDEAEMIKQGIEINSWANNIYVKVPIINSKGIYTENVIKTLNKLNIKLNITAIFTQEQANVAYNSILNKNISTIISLFSGRIADTGIDPKNICIETVNMCKNTNIEVLWASTREVYNIFQAIEYGCDIITIPDDVLKRKKYIGKDLTEYSIETVKTFYNDAIKSNINF
jgi:transaldolase